MQRLESLTALKAYRSGLKDSVAFVPTMGALHEGHLALIEKAKTLAPTVIVSIFVNPLQFGPSEDFNRYPRTLENDLKRCKEHGVAAVFCPTADELYPEGLDALTQVIPPKSLTENYCGAARPGHFVGVATVVLKLFELVQPQFAVFGEKDAQQLAIIRRMVSDLNLPVEIVPVATVREYDGLAKSSRNRYLQEADRREARLLSRLITAVQEQYFQGQNDAKQAMQQAKNITLDPALYPDFELEYLAVVDEHTFQPVETLSEVSRVLVAARIGEVRLIDNARLETPLLPEVPTALEKTPVTEFSLHKI